MRNKNFRYIVIYLSITLFSLIACAIYYYFSHGETDGHMTYLYVPSLGMSVIFLALFLFKIQLNHRTYYLINSAFTFLWFYMFIMGIYLIAYVENKWTFVFWICSIVALACAIGNEIIYRLIRRDE